MLASTAKTLLKDAPRKPYQVTNPVKPANQPGAVATNEERSRDRAGNRCYHLPLS